MTARLLDPSEWADKLIGTELDTVRQTLPHSASVIGVEDDDGHLIGCWALLPVHHAEGMWIAPEARKSGAVGLALLRAMRTLMIAHDVGSVVTASVDPTMSAWIERRGGSLLPGQHYLLPVGDV